MSLIDLPNLMNILSGLGIPMEMIEFKKGGSYTVLSNSGSETPMKTQGEFVGYTILGEESAVVFRVKKKNEKFTLRLIPVSNMFYIEFNESDIVKKKEDKKEDSEKTNYIS